MSEARGARGAAREWYSAGEIVEARSPDLPGTIQAFNRLADAKGWRADPARARRVGGRGGGWEYHLSILPPAAQARLTLMHAQKEAPEPAQNEASKALWARFEALPARAKEEARQRLSVIATVDELTGTGMTVSAAAAIAARRHEVASRTIFEWRKAIAGLAREDRLAALAPEWKATASFADCHKLAWEALLSDWLRPEKPGFSASYRRMRKIASANGWLPIPSERALRRRVEKEVPAGVIAMARSGRDKAKTLYPAQRRSRATLHAMQAVNMDGHKFDVFVSVPWSEKPVRMILIALQDLYSGKFVAWRLSETENKAVVRLVIGDMVERFGIPEKIVLDNGRAFASKDISGGTPNRFRFKVRDEDPQGLLTTLGVEILWTLPYSGQSKPIERAFRDMCEEIAQHPFCAGAYVGNSPDAKPENYMSRAIPLADFRAFVDTQIAEHNARTDRRSETSAGRSFDQTFEESYARSIITKASPSQRALWLMAADRVTAQRGSGEIRLFGNRYWSRELNAVAGSKVTVRFDPENLHQPVRVYDRKDRLICVADCVDDTGFFDAEGAQRHARDRAAYLKSLKDQQRLLATMKAEDLGRMLYDPAAQRAPEKPVQPGVTRLAVPAARAAQHDDAGRNQDDDFDFEEAFSRGVRLIASNE